VSRSCPHSEHFGLTKPPFATCTKKAGALQHRDVFPLDIRIGNVFQSFGDSKARMKYPP
jgi:hypothetical protein